MRIALFSLLAIVMLGSCTKTVTKNNTVNQAFSAVYTVSPNQWTQGSESDGNGGTRTFFYSTLSIPELDDIINLNGGVETYLSFDDVNSTTPTYETLPEVVSGVAYGSIHTTGTVTIDLRAADGGSLTSAIAKDVRVKVVLIDAAPLD